MNWQPIETAPIGVPILILAGRYIVVGKIPKSYKLINDGWDDYPDEYGFGGYEWEWDFAPDDVTHWMPLPAPPEQ